MVVKSILLLTLICHINAKLKAIDDTEHWYYNECLLRVAKKLFVEDQYLHMLIDDKEIDWIPFNTSYVKVVFGDSGRQYVLDRNALTHQQYIISASRIESLESILRILFDKAVPKIENTKRGTFIVTVPYSMVKITFERLWAYQVFNAVILTKDIVKNSKNFTLWQSHPKTVKNKCGGEANVIDRQTCENDFKLIFSVGFRRFFDCPVGYRQMDYGLVRHHYVKIVFELLITKFRWCIENSWSHFSDYFRISKLAYVQSPGEELVQVEWFFILPLPEQKSKIEIFATILQYEVWIMIAIGFCVTVVCYLVILALHQLQVDFNVFTYANLQVLSITFWGSTSTLTTLNAIRPLLLCYIFYAIVIQTGYISGLIRVLTIPQYEKRINDLTELADSDVVIYHYDSITFSAAIQGYTRRTKLGQKLNERIWSSAKKSSFNCDIHNNERCAIMMTNDEMADYLSKMNHFYNKIVRIDDVLDNLSIGYGVMARSLYLKDTIEKVITLLKEHGILSKFEKEEQAHYKRSFRPYDYPEDPQVLTLSHIYGVFVIWAFCLSFSFFVFLCEIVVYKLKNIFKRYKRKRVQPLHHVEEVHNQTA